MKRVRSVDFSQPSSGIDRRVSGRATLAIQALAQGDRRKQGQCDPAQRADDDENNQQK